MEFLHVSLLSLFVMLITSLFLRLRFCKNKSGLSGTLPPGSFGWPIVGESLHFLYAGLRGYPKKFIFDRMVKYSPSIFRSHLLGEPTAVFCGATGNKFLFSNENNLVHVCWPISTEKVFQPRPESSMKERSIQLKKVISDLVKPEPLQRYIGIMDKIANRLFASHWENKDQIEAFPACKDYAFMVATKLFVSVEDTTEVAKLRERYNDISSGLFSIPIDFPGTQFNRAIKASRDMRKMFLDILKQRKIDLAEGKATASQDFLSHMLMMSDEDGKLKHEIDIANSFVSLLLAGHDTIASACCFVVNFLAELPDVYHGVYTEQMKIAQQKVAGELLNWGDIQKMKYSWNVACECLRLFPPLQGTFREALTDFTYDGFKIPKGWKLHWNAYSTHMNPEYFPEPDKFDPSRFEGNGPVPFSFVPFGGGPRMCTGKEFARIGILVFMHNLVKRFRFEKVIPDEGVTVSPTPKPVKGLPLRLYPHKA